MRILLSGLLLVLPLPAFSDDDPFLKCEPEPYEQAECICNYIDGTDYVLGIGDTYEKAVEDSKEMCMIVVREVLILDKGWTEAKAAQYDDYDSHVTNDCRPTSCILENQRLGLE